MESRTEESATSIYVAGLPDDVTTDELVRVFSRYGLIGVQASGAPRVRLYTDKATGKFKGDALVTFLKPESVPLAIELMDDAPLRAEDPASPRVSVSRARFPSTAAKGVSSGATEKPQDAGVKAKAAATATATAISQASKNGHTEQKKESQGSAADRMQARAKRARLAKKLDWNENEDEEKGKRKAQNIVVLRHMFSLDDIAKDPALIIDIKAEVQQECERVGTVTKTMLYDLEPEGIITVRFRDPISALACVKLMHDRFFDGRQVVAELLDPKTHPRFKSTSDRKPSSLDEHEKSDMDNDSPDEDAKLYEAKRIRQFETWVEEYNPSKD